MYFFNLFSNMSFVKKYYSESDVASSEMVGIHAGTVLTLFLDMLQTRAAVDC